MGERKNFLKRAEERLTKAIRWRADALEIDPSFRTLVRPQAGLAKEARERRANSLLSPSVRAAVKFKRPTGHQQRYEWAEAFFDTPVQTNKVFYESFSGNGALCNPRAVFEYLISHDEYDHLEHVWALNDGESRNVFESEFSRHSNVRTVTHGSTKYWQDLSTSKYLFNNSTFLWKFTKRPEQVYINTWHGTPVKTMGYDSNEGAFGAANILRNFVQADYIVSPNRYTTETMIESAYKMQGVYEGEILEYGYPRIDAQFGGAERRENILDRLRSTGVELSGKAPIVLYAPTWRGKDFQSAESSAGRFEQLVKMFDDRFGDDAVLLLKVHQQVYEIERRNESVQANLVPNSLPTNDVLAVADVLISDYSSVWVDFVASKKPVVFYVPDQDDYESTRGTYFTDRPGREILNPEDLLDEIARVLPDKPSGRVNRDVLGDGYDRIREKFCSLEDGSSTSRLVQRIFKDQGVNDAGTAHREVHCEDSSGRLKVLFYLGGMRRNGITTSGLNLLNNLDPEKYDVSIWAPRPGKNSDNDMYARIPSSVRQFLRYDSHPLSKPLSDRLQTYLNDGDVDNHALPEDLEKVFKTEWARCFGESRFDYIIDFSGYAGFWSLILAQGPCSRKRLVWAHNDLESDRNKVVEGRHPNDAALVAQYKAYQFYDGLVSVSESLSEVNSKNLWPYVKPNGFYSVRNSLDLRRLDRTLRGGDLVEIESADRGTANLVDVLRGLRKFGDARDIEHLLKSQNEQDEVFSEPDVFHFVSVGRLAPEKNQHRLLRAFSICLESEPRVRLTILGDGPLLSELQQLAVELGISDRVDFMGNRPEVLTYMRRADLFVLSSDFEGQPMVFMEALSIGTPILTVDFPTIASALPQGQGVICDSSDEALGEEMLAFATGDRKVEPTFDATVYNQEVLDEFERVLSS